ncbi:MAG: Histidinol dehydrogenase [uncultured Thermomicrobiales bacterium]|uniref:Histidinol dehydrogenase n=1 Tax=uncultured Thermomicrobiales bacterium TaxID=1645740 RepID=A0A6J4VDF5_9BACT|nr:MAG: Histidinol dehydrogenase [uncultured Thermomicrobiales bacterium]
MVTDRPTDLIQVIRDIDVARQRLTRRRGYIEPELSPVARDGIRRVFGADLTVEQVVDRILADVRNDGDAAIRRYTEAFDRVIPYPIEVPRSVWEESYEALPPELAQALEIAAEQIERYHRKQLRTSWIDWSDEGALGQIVRPIERVGLYVPGGLAAYPSSLMMTAIPARVAGVDEIVVCAPPTGGSISPVVLAAAAVAGVDRVFQVGGAQAIAAMAYGTESIPDVDKIYGPGNIFVVTAKRRVAGTVGIEFLPGPTETLVIADDGANPVHVAADLLAQAEHDPMASPILITTSERMAELVRRQLATQLEPLERADIARAALRRNGVIAVAPNVEVAVELANAFAPEHLCLLVRDPWDLVPQVRNAGGIFVGEDSPEALADYTLGPSHVMPTGGSARFASPIHVADFTKVISVAAGNRRALERLGPTAALFARAEGLTGHARAIEQRLEELRD